MLHALHIENLAVVEKLTLPLATGLTIISGETGAGKSILIDALGLALGERAESHFVRQGANSALVEATFLLSPTLQTWLQQHDISLQVKHPEQCVIQRIISNNGRSKAFINQQAVNVQLLRDLSALLIDIHGQHAHQSLLKQEVQRQLLDDMSDNQGLLTAATHAYQHWKQCKTDLIALGGNAADREARLDFLRYQVQELENYTLTDEAITQLDSEHRRLANASQLLENGQRALQLLDADEGYAVLSSLVQAGQEISSVQQHDAQLTSINTLLDSAIIQTQEAISELHSYLNHLDIDASRLVQLEQEIAGLQTLARKHKVKVQALPQVYAQLCEQLDGLENYEQRAHLLEIELKQALQTYQQAALVLSQQRSQMAITLAAQITRNMQCLGMPSGQLSIVVTPDIDASPSPLGMDKIEFLVSANPGQAPKSLQKVASGGELSRISLAIQVITAQKSGVPTLVFDEVDVGIGGGTAEIVGQLLQKLGENRQVLCITHLPQVACQGHHHLQVSKTVRKQVTQTQIKALNVQQRIEEIARMLGGVEMTPQTLAHATEMLQRGTHSMIGD
ncbi:DNA repair protein RecN [Beggiatoa leptomitoformis]|uniref:DNA repair protein RecN n=1 Tax=Beggiatoa leptomitoformis TaxID=288004 RepID=A0A2N9YI20_9GAMM|nr:DNA repair protein RecN [Beggiatoa leptomitoformis]ALG67589.1 DNA repair protein RecN [Beggiatoa leptomitoformis]AUI70178.1 DNA repair protein RecN [Beggiatoa leptomitoformis]